MQRKDYTQFVPVLEALRASGKSRLEILKEGLMNTAEYRIAAELIRDKKLTAEKSVMQETQISAEIEQICTENSPKPTKSKKHSTEDEIRNRIATAELTLPFSNWLGDGNWVRETADPVDIYETNEDGEQVLVGQKLDPGVMWPINYTGAKTYNEIILEGIPAPRDVKAGFVLTAQQEGTPLCGPAWITMAAIAAARGHYKMGVGGFTYQKKWFQRSSKQDVAEVAPWPAMIEPLVRRSRFDLHDQVQFAAEMNISPTASSPLTGLMKYIKSVTTVFPHPKREIESVPRHSWKQDVHMWTTGACSVPNYILQKAGLIALQAHTIGCVIVEIDHQDRVFLRNVDINPYTGEARDIELHVVDGVVRIDKEYREANNLPGPVMAVGCLHVPNLNADHARGIFGIGEQEAEDLALVDVVDPAYQIFHDLHDGESINHHEDHDPLALYSRHTRQRNHLDVELDAAASFLKATYRPTTQTIVVNSNHDDFVRRWLLKPSQQIEIQNAKLWHRLNYLMRELIELGKRPKPFELVMREKAPELNLEFIGPDDPCEIYGTHFGYHGDKGPDGSRGSTAGLARMGVPIIKAHDHKMTWKDYVKSVGNLLGKALYATGPTSWTGSWSLVHCDGSTQMGNMVGSKWRA